MLSGLLRGHRTMRAAKRVMLYGKLLDPEDFRIFPQRHLKAASDV